MTPFEQQRTLVDSQSARVSGSNPWGKQELWTPRFKILSGMATIGNHLRVRLGKNNQSALLFDGVIVGVKYTNNA